VATKTVGRAATDRAAALKKAVAPGKPSQRQASTRASAPKKTVAADEPSRPQATTQVVEQARPRRPVGHALLAAEQAIRRDSLHLHLPIVGELHLPAAEEVAFIGGIAAMAVLGLLEWPVAVLLGVGHGLALNRRNRVVRAFGEALEEA
jgi:hypothetical protein